MPRLKFFVKVFFASLLLIPVLLAILLGIVIGLGYLVNRHPLAAVGAAIFLLAFWTASFVTEMMNK